MSCDQPEVQLQFAEDLWLLRKLSPMMSTSPSVEISRDAYQRLVLSDTVALYLTTDDRDGVVAAFYMPQDSILFLAKNGSSDPSYAAESAVFFRELANANAFEDLLPFLARRSCNRVNKRIRKLRYYYHRSSGELLDAAKEYEPTNTEFDGPWYRKFVQIIQAENQLDTLSLKEILLHVLTFCKDQLENNLEFSDKPESHHWFARLLYAASALLHSDFFTWFEHENSLIRLGRHLEKITDYLRVSRLIKIWRRYGKDTRIKWITDMEQNNVPCTLVTAGIGERRVQAAYQRQVGEAGDDYRPIMLENMDFRYPGWQGEVSETINFVPCMHGEIRLIIYLMRSFPDLQNQHDEELPIGCGQRTCFTCTLWINEFNRILKMNWKTRRSNGRAQYDCALPVAEAVVPYVGIDGYHSITSHILQRLADELRLVVNTELRQAIEDFIDARCLERSLRVVLTHLRLSDSLSNL